MANSKYEYVKQFEQPDQIMFPNLIVVRVDGRNFKRFAEVHKFEKPNDRRALKLMKSCAVAVMEGYHGIGTAPGFSDTAFAYGFSDEFSFVFRKETGFYRRRESKLLSLVVSFFTSLYIFKWREFFPHRELLYVPSFHAQIIHCPTLEVLQNYLAWRQNDCHYNNQFDTCFWKLVEGGNSEAEALEILKGTQKKEKNELLFQQFGINYKTLHPMFRQGTCLLKSQVAEVIKYRENGDPVTRTRPKVMKVRSENIASKRFWNEHPSLLKELGRFEENIRKIRPEYTESFLFQAQLMCATWIVVRIDGCHFHRFSDVHEFEKPNDEQALNLMNSCAAAVMEGFKDIIFGYGVSDEFSFVLRKESEFYERQASRIVSVMVSFFSAMYVQKWKYFFPKKELRYPPSFDGRAVCYPTSQILRDYLSWRQVDCHINNQYNTCYSMMVKSGKSRRDAKVDLERTQTQEKIDFLVRNGIDYNALPDIFRRGSSVFLDEETKMDSGEILSMRIVVEHCNIIDQDFWDAYPWILDDERHKSI